MKLRFFFDEKYCIYRLLDCNSIGNISIYFKKKKTTTTTSISQRQKILIKNLLLLSFFKLYNKVRI
jgi:hypothetical protein